MEIHDLRNLTPEDLQHQIAVLENDYHEALEHVRSGKEKNHASLRGLRRAIARAKTVGTEQRAAALVEA